MLAQSICKRFFVKICIDFFEGTMNVFCYYLSFIDDGGHNMDYHFQLRLLFNLEDQVFCNFDTKNPKDQFAPCQMILNERQLAYNLYCLSTLIFVISLLYYKYIQRGYLMLCCCFLSHFCQFSIHISNSSFRYLIQIVVYYNQDMENNISDEEITAFANKNIQLLKAIDADSKWKANGEVKGTKICKMFKMDVENRIASKGVVEDVDGTIEQLYELLRNNDFAIKLDEQMTEIKVLKQINKDTHVYYYRFKGMGPVSDRDFITAEKIQFENNNQQLFFATRSFPYPFPQLKGIVRGECIIGGYLAEKKDQKTMKVTYISDGDVKGSIPDFIKKIFSKGQGEVVSKVNDLLKVWRQSVQSKK